MGLPANPIGAAISGRLSVAKTALPPNPLKGLVSPGVSPVPALAAPPSHTLPPGGLEQAQAATQKASAAGVDDFNRRAGTGFHDVPAGWKAEDVKQIHDMAQRNPDVAKFWGSLVNPVEWGIQGVEGAKQAAHGVGELAHGKLAHGAEDVGLGGLSAAAVLPFGRGAKAVEEATVAARELGASEHATEAARGSLLKRPEWLGGGLPHRTQAEATAHLSPLLDQAKAEGWGGHVGTEGHPPVVEHGAATPDTHGELGQTVRESLLHAPAVREAQKPLHSLERGARAQAAEQAMKEAGGGTAGLHAALSELEGRFGRESFAHLQHLSPGELDTLHHAVDEAPLQTYERITANKALSNAVHDGVAPTEGEQALLERVFGKVAEDVPVEKPSLGERAAGILNVPRAIRSAADLSLSFRQNIVTAVTHPSVFAKSFAKSARMFVDPAYHRAIMDEIHDDPYYPYLQKISSGKLFTEIGDTAQEGAGLLKREEAFNGGNVAERLNLRELPGPLKGKKYASGPGDVVRASDRAFTGGLNYSRFMVGKNLVEKAALMGHDLADPKVGESIADVMGMMTGRGKVPRWVEPHLVTANLALFAPRLIASRLNLLSPVYYYKLDPFARGEALAAARNMVAAMGTVMVAAKIAGASVNFNPESSNFGKIRLGNTRIDITGGFSQYVRFIAQEMTRTEISSSGHTSHIGWGPHDVSDWDDTVKQVRSKAAPIPSLVWDEGTGKDFIGRPVKQGHELWSNAPFIAQDVYDTAQTGATPPKIAAAAFLSAIGFGVQSYKDKPQGRPTPKGGGSGLPSLPALPQLPSLPALPEKP